MRNRTLAKTEKFASEVCSEVEKEGEERDDLGLLEGKREAIEKEVRELYKGDENGNSDCNSQKASRNGITFYLCGFLNFIEV